MKARRAAITVTDPQDEKHLWLRPGGPSTERKIDVRIALDHAKKKLHGEDNKAIDELLRELGLEV